MVRASERERERERERRRWTEKKHSLMNKLFFCGNSETRWEETQKVKALRT